MSSPDSQRPNEVGILTCSIALLQYYFATILLQNELHRDEGCSVLCTTREAETQFGFNYLQFMELYSKFPELAFNQWVDGSSPSRLIAKYT